MIARFHYFVTNDSGCVDIPRICETCWYRIERSSFQDDFVHTLQLTHICVGSVGDILINEIFVFLRPRITLFELVLGSQSLDTRNAMVIRTQVKNTGGPSTHNRGELVGHQQASCLVVGGLFPRHGSIGTKMKLLHYSHEVSMGIIISFD